MPMDSAEKVFTSYFPAVTKKPFTFKKVTYQPQPLRVSPQIFRGFECKENCGGCCRKFSLDFIPTEKLPEGYTGLKERTVVVNGKNFILLTDPNEDGTDDYYCKHLNK